MRTLGSKLFQSARERTSIVLDVLNGIWLICLGNHEEKIDQGDFKQILGLLKIERKIESYNQKIPNVRDVGLSGILFLYFYI